ncbi:MAG: preprotein translocase subunit SecY, partial [Flavobacteriaceae bacterium]|nr:preprotein translocase subunit SecY [Flavobacteriaceae bacterium]
MKNFISTIQDIWKIEELRNKIILTLGLMVVYRLAAQVPLPGIDPTQLSGLQNTTDSNNILGLLNAFTGGAFAQASVMALGIMPYISASIVVQLMGIAVPYLQKLQKEGASGQKKITQITRWLTVGILIIQAPTYIVSLPTLGIPPSAFLLGNGPMFWFSSIILLTAGTIFAMWLGEKITDKGIGNGISLLIMIGIIATFPSSFSQEMSSRINAGSGGILMV